jgi:hypothetical protein
MFNVLKNVLGGSVFNLYNINRVRGMLASFTRTGQQSCVLG